MAHLFKETVRTASQCAHSPHASKWPPTTSASTKRYAMDLQAFEIMCVLSYLMLHTHVQLNLTEVIFKLSHLHIFQSYNILKDKLFAFDLRTLGWPTKIAPNPLLQLGLFVSSYYYCLCSRLIISALFLQGFTQDYSFYTSCWNLLKTLIGMCSDTEFICRIPKLVTEVIMTKVIYLWPLTSGFQQPFLHSHIYKQSHTWMVVSYFLTNARWQSKLVILYQQ